MRIHTPLSQHGHEHMPKVTVSEAARLSGVPRSSIYKKIKTGEMSFEKIDGRTVIDPSELARVFPSDRPKIKRGSTTTPIDSLQDQLETVDSIASNQACLQQVENLKHHIETLLDTIKMMKEDKNRLLTLLETKMLTDQREQIPGQSKKSKPKKPKGNGKKEKKGKKNK